jgi:cystathionine gamma-lyase
LLQLIDLRQLTVQVQEANAKRSQEDNDLLLAVDNTFATAFNQRPLDMGADIVMISTSKFIGGHSDMIGGAVVVRKEGESGVKRKEDLAARVMHLSKAVGAIAGPFDCYLALRGMKTLAVRMERQASNALQIAKFLEKEMNRSDGKSAIKDVHYPGLEGHESYELCKAQMRTAGSVITIRLRENEDYTNPTSEEQNRSLVNRFVSGLHIFVLAESLGGVESMVNHSASMSHESLGRGKRAAAGIYDTTLRVSVGIENAEDLIGDLAKGLVGI